MMGDELQGLTEELPERLKTIARNFEVIQETLNEHSKMIQEIMERLIKEQSNE